MLKIGSFTIKNPFILAPMAGVSQMPFRRLALKMGAGLAPTELISAKGLYFESSRTKSYLTYDKTIENPFCVQLFGGEVESMAVAAEKAMAMGADIIDINMGCPVKKVTKTNAGSALLCDQKRASAIVEAMLKATSYKIPITAKIRSGWDERSLNFLEVGKALEDAGISAIALHARTRAQGYSGKANWLQIKELKEGLKIPVIGNGDVLSLKDALAMKNLTGCDAVMVGRAALGNPWLFKELALGQEKIAVGSLERWQTVREHLFDHIELQKIVFDVEKIDERSEMQSLRSFRSHLIWYSKGLMGGAKFRSSIMAAASKTETFDLIDEFFNRAELSNTTEEPCEDGIDYRQAFG